MKLFLRVVCLASAIALSAAEIANFQDVAYDYHRRLGIPEASRILNSEIAKIVGGTVNDVSRTPYQAGLVVQILPIFTSVCGASLISATRLVTAAHCYFDGFFTAQFFTVVLGSNKLFSGGVRIITDDIVVHPNWNYFTIANDIAVIRISPVSFSDVIQPITLPSGNEISKDFAGWDAVASGYGLTAVGGSIGNNQPISSVTLTIITNAECAAVYSNFVRNSNICTSGAGGKGTCHGDSGGPLAVISNGRSVLIGVSSFGAGAGCTAGYPSGFTRLTCYQNWIQSQ